MKAGFSYYDILGVSQTASTIEIEAAYRDAMDKYHPDDSAPNAEHVTEVLKEAYDVLSDPDKRRSYDSSIEAGTQISGTEEESNEPWELYTCDGCQKTDVQLRYAVFYKVWSIIIYSRMQPAGGVFCPECRSKVAMSSALFSAFLGPWGLPWGFFFTIRSLFASLRGGNLPRQQNAELLYHQGIAFLQRGLTNEARTSLTDSLKFEKTDAVKSLLNDSVFGLSTVLPGPGWLIGQTVAAFLFAVPPLIVMLVALWYVYSPNTTVTSSETATDQQQNEGALKHMIQGCAAASSPTKSAGAYINCNRAMTWIEDDMKDSTPGTSDYEEYSLILDNARAFKAIAAANLGKSKEASALIDESLNSFRSLTTRGVSVQVRSDAKKDWEAWVNAAASK